MSEPKVDDVETPSRTRGERTPESKLAISGSTNVTLSVPILIGGSKVGVIKLRRPKVRDLLAVDQKDLTEMEREARFIGNLCGLAPEEIDDLDCGDFAKLQEAVAAFRAAPPKK